VKILVRLLLLAILGLVLVGGAVYFFLGSIVRAGIEKGGETALGVNTPVEGVDIVFGEGGFGEARVEISGLTVKSPAGFQRPDVLRLGRAEVAVPIASLRDDPLIVEKVEIGDLALVLERQNGAFNYEALLEHAKRLTGPRDTTDPAPGEPAPGSSRRMLFKEITIDGVALTVDVLPGTLPAQTLTLGRYTLRDIEVGGDADPLGELLARLLDATVEFGLAQADGLLPADVASIIGNARAKLDAKASEQLDELRSRAEKELEKAAGDLSEKVQDLFGGKQGDMAPPGDAPKKLADDAKKKLGGLLGGNKDG